MLRGYQPRKSHTSLPTLPIPIPIPVFPPSPTAKPLHLPRHLQEPPLLRARLKLHFHLLNVPPPVRLLLHQLRLPPLLALPPLRRLPPLSPVLDPNIQPLDLDPSLPVLPDPHRVLRRRVQPEHQVILRPRYRCRRGTPFPPRRPKGRGVVYHADQRRRIRAVVPQPQVLEPAELDLGAEGALEGRRVQAHGARRGEGEEELQGRHEGRLEQRGRLRVWKDVRGPVRLAFLQGLDGGVEGGGGREEA